MLRLSDEYHGPSLSPDPPRLQCLRCGLLAIVARTGRLPAPPPAYAGGSQFTLVARGARQVRRGVRSSLRADRRRGSTRQRGSLGRKPEVVTRQSDQ